MFYVWLFGCAGTIVAVAAFALVWVVGPTMILASAALWVLGLAVTLIVVACAVTAAVLTVLVLPLVFAVMALLRLFVLAPSAWEALFYLASHVATEVDAVVPFNYFDNAARDRLFSSVFGLTDKDLDDRSADDLLKMTVKYLAVEFCLESLPQLVVQVVNNNAQPEWSYIAIASFTVSVYAIVSTVYKYGCKSRKKARRSVQQGNTGSRAVEETSFGFEIQSIEAMIAADDNDSGDEVSQE